MPPFGDSRRTSRLATGRWRVSFRTWPWIFPCARSPADIKRPNKRRLNEGRARDRIEALRSIYRLFRHSAVRVDVPTMAAALTWRYLPGATLNLDGAQTGREMRAMWNSVLWPGFPINSCRAGQAEIGRASCRERG